jgi:hypothetical protein
VSAILLHLPILPLLITLAIAAATIGIRVGSQLGERRHRADLIQQAAVIRGERAIRGRQ